MPYVQKKQTFRDKICETSTDYIQYSVLHIGEKITPQIPCGQNKHAATLSSINPGKGRAAFIWA